jgi:hypothetical protein
MGAKLLSHIKERSLTVGVQEQGAEENIWIIEA